jgi:competence protein ComEC
MVLQTNIFVRLLIPFCIGIAVLHYCDLTKYNLPLYILIFVALILLLTINYLYRSLKVYRYKLKLGFLIYSFFFLLGAFAVVTDPDRLDSDHYSTRKAEFLKLYVADEPKETAGIIRFKARVISIVRQRQITRSGGLLMVSLHSGEDAHPIISYGKVYLIPAHYTSIPEPLNPAEFDSKTWMANQYIYHQAPLSGPELIPLHESRGSPLISYALALRKKQVERYRKLIKSDQAFAVAVTLILGYRAELDPETLATYSKTGTIHALSVSGMHVAMIYLILEYALGWMKRHYTLRWIKVILILALIWFYTLVTGCSASVLRSAIMLTVLIISKALHKHTGGYHVLALSAFALLFTDAKLLWDVGFQLSYLAVAGLIYLQPRIYMFLSFQSWLLRQGWSIVSVSLAAQLFTWPLSIYYFHQFPVYFLLSNLFIAFPVAVLMYTGLIILLFRFYWLAQPFEWLLTLMNDGLAHIAGLPYSLIQQIWITKAELAILSAALLFMIRAWSEKKKTSLLAGLFMLIVFQLMLLHDKTVAWRQRMIILYSLNRNYAVAFIQSDKAFLLTDLRPKDRAFQYHVLPGLEQRRISEIIFLPWHHIYHQSIRHQRLKGLYINDHQLRFRNYKVLLADSFFNHKNIMGMPAFDAIWIHGSPAIKTGQLRTTVRFKEIWIDATNPNSLISKIERDTLNVQKSIIVFKQIKASLVNLQ